MVKGGDCKGQGLLKWLSFMSVSEEAVGHQGQDTRGEGWREMETEGGSGTACVCTFHRELHHHPSMRYRGGFLPAQRETNGGRFRIL